MYGQANENLVTEKSSITASDGKKYQTKIYNLDAIMSVGYTMQYISSMDEMYQRYLKENKE